MHGGASCDHTQKLPCWYSLLKMAAGCGCYVAVLVLFLSFVIFVAIRLTDNPSDPEVDYDAIQLISSKGYHAESHWVTTSDGYILCMQRIPGPRHETQSKEGPRPVFFLQHGLITSSTNWLTNLENQSFAYILADAGFDVWMGNIRGNTYSKNHTSLKTDSREFWDFSIDEHAQIDLPAMLNYVMKVTGQDELFYVGHSQGTAMGFAGFTFNQSLARHIKAFFALAPVATVKYIKGLFAFMAEKLDDAVDVLGDDGVLDVLSLLGGGEFFYRSELTKLFGEFGCADDVDLVDLCGNVLFLISGYDHSNLNDSRLPVYYTHIPAGTSVKNALHYVQLVNSGGFAMYDYGSVSENQQHYGLPTSPSYNLTHLNVPVAVFAGGQDWLATPRDVAGLIPKINSTGKVFYFKNIDKYNHLDFIWGLDAATVIYRDIVDIALKMMTQN